MNLIEINDRVEHIRYLASNAGQGERLKGALYAAVLRSIAAGEGIAIESARAALKCEEFFPEPEYL